MRTARHICISLVTRNIRKKLDREAAESGDDYRKNPAALGGAISQNGGTQQSKGTQETGGKKAYYNPGKERSKIEKK